MNQTATASAPGKVILFGEHAVVHDQPAIAVPLTSVRVTATATPKSDGDILTVQAHSVNHDVTVSSATTPPDDPFYYGLLYPVELARQQLGLPPTGLSITLDSTIPLASGLGSGAAVATALIRATCAAYGVELDTETLNGLVYEVEKHHHGTPSGIDNTVIVYQKPVYFVRGEAPTTFTIARPFTLLVANSGQSSPTHITVGDVRRLYEAEPERIGDLFARIGVIVQAARYAIESGTIEALGPLMSENHALLRELTVSSDRLDRLCDAACQAGAPGAKLSGGGRGGNVVALATPDRVEAIRRALQAAGAVSVIEATIQ